MNSVPAWYYLPTDPNAVPHIHIFHNHAEAPFVPPIPGAHGETSSLTVYSLLPPAGPCNIRRRLIGHGSHGGLYGGSSPTWPHHIVAFIHPSRDQAPLQSVCTSFPSTSLFLGFMTTGQNSAAASRFVSPSTCSHSSRGRLRATPAQIAVRVSSLATSNAPRRRMTADRRRGKCFVSLSLGWAVGGRRT